MTTPEERTRTLVQTKEFLQPLLDPAQTPRTPKPVRTEAKRLLRHYPLPWDMELLHEALPLRFAPAIKYGDEE